MHIHNGSDEWFKFDTLEYESVDIIYLEYVSFNTRFARLWQNTLWSVRINADPQNCIL